MFIKSMQATETEDEMMDHEWADENLDEEIKEILSIAENSAKLPLDIVAHMEYFYNTLDCHFKTENPFKFSMKYAALVNTIEGNKPLFEQHKVIIFPASSDSHGITTMENTKSLQYSSSNDSHTFPKGKFSKPYSWYPNGSIGSPTKYHVSHTPTPKTINSMRRPSGISNNPFARLDLNPMLDVGFGESVQSFSKLGDI